MVRDCMRHAITGIRYFTRRYQLKQSRYLTSAKYEAHYDNIVGFFTNITKQFMARKQHNRLPEKHSTLAQYFKPRNNKQQQLVELIEDNEVVIAKGIPGSGKTYVALATALNLLGGIYKKVILVKSVTTLLGEEIGFLKGGINDKMEPHMMSFM